MTGPNISESLYIYVKYILKIYRFLKIKMQVSIVLINNDNVVSKWITP